MRLFRIADSRHPLWDGQGALRLGGRFNSPDQPVVSAALTYAGALLEILAQARIGKLPRQQVFVMAEIPDHLAIERADRSRLPPGWDQPESPSARAFGDQWLAEQRPPYSWFPQWWPVRSGMR
ncbi:RES family NAD+ phosphorylase [unidentified bacterial endosymbiont]|uniref:RES family NAD+ phosphorylase n=1 Tax=unidentified bacterial endosymbiont TaxID=2355 RepID=UPI00344DDFF7